MQRTRQWIGFIFLAAAALSAAAQPENPGGISISPIRVDLHAGERGTAVTLTNTSAERKTIQVESWAWSQSADDDVHAETHDLVVNPPLFFIEPGKSQVVRVGRSAAAAPVSGEQTFRIYFREVAPEGGAGAGGNMLRVALRIGIPVFMTDADKTAAPALTWSGVVHRDGSAEITVRNDGTRHARAADVRVLGATDATVLAHPEGFHYVLAHARQNWKLPPHSGLHAGPARVAVLLEEGAKEFPLVLDAD